MRKNSKPLIEMKEIIKRYNIGTESEIEILHGIDLKIYEGEFVAIVGESGSGKSTLMNIIGVLDKQTEGEYYLDGIDIKNANEEEMNVIRNKKIGFVFQNFNLIGRTSALKNVELPMLYAGVPAEERTKRAKELLSKVGMASRANHMPNELSGGQKQRVAIASVLAMNPKIIVFDESTSMLDPTAKGELKKLMLLLRNKFHKTIISITHDMEEIVLADKVMVINKGTLQAYDEPETVFANQDFLRDNSLDIPYCLQLSKYIHSYFDNVPLTLDENKLLEEINKICQQKK